MTNTEIIAKLNSIAAKYGYGQGTEPFADDEWNAIGLAKELINDYARLTAENQRLREEAAEQKSIAEHEHATQMEWFQIACDYKAENVELRARLDKAVELQFSNGDEVYAIMDTLLYTGVFPVTIKSADVVYEVFDGEQITTQHRTRIFATRAEAEAHIKELQGGKR